MVNDIIDIVDNKGNTTGVKKLKSEAHKDGSWHQTAHIWIFNSKKEVLLQKRAKDKMDFPGLWDISAAGHLSAGETPESGAVRELFEEIGINMDPSKLKKIEVRKIIQHIPELNFHNNEFAHIYLLEFNGNPKELKIQEEEIESVKFLSLKKFKSEVKDTRTAKKYVPHGQYYLDIIHAIEKELE